MADNTITIVYRDVTPAEAVALGEHPKARASSWSDLMGERDRIGRNRDMWKDQCAAQAATLATVTPLVQQMLEAMRSCVWLTDREIVEQNFDEDKVDDACKAARAFLSGATKESTDA